MDIELAAWKDQVAFHRIQGNSIGLMTQVVYPRDRHVSFWHPGVRHDSELHSICSIFFSPSIERLVVRRMAAHHVIEDARG